MALLCPQIRYNGIHLHRTLSDDDIRIIQNTLAQIDCLSLSLIRQIGSFSERATIWESILPIHDKYFVIAIKISHPDNYRPQEYEIAKILRKYPQYFLQMFAHKECPVMIGRRSPNASSMK